MQLAPCQTLERNLLVTQRVTPPPPTGLEFVCGAVFMLVSGLYVFVFSSRWAWHLQRATIALFSFPASLLSSSSVTMTIIPSDYKGHPCFLTVALIFGCTGVSCLPLSHQPFTAKTPVALSQSNKSYRSFSREVWNKALENHYSQSSH